MLVGWRVGSPRGSTNRAKFDPTSSMAPPDDHDCPLTDLVQEQQRRIDQLLERAEKQDREIAQLKKALMGPKSERTKMPSVQDAIGKEPVSAENRLARRRQNAQEKQQLEVVRVEHKVPEAQRSCPKCGHGTLTPLGAGRTTTVYEFVPARLVRVEHVQEVLRCRCGDHIVTAPGAPKVFEQGRYGASLLAHLVVAKCVDSIPLYRIEKDFKRQGVPVSRSTMNELFHRAAQMLCPVSDRLLEQIRHRNVVLADETRLRMQDGGNGKPKTGFQWTFVAEDNKCSAARPARCWWTRIAATMQSRMCPHASAQPVTPTCGATSMRPCPARQSRKKPSTSAIAITSTRPCARSRPATSSCRSATRASPP